MKATPPPPPPRTTPVKPGIVVQMGNGHGPVHGPPGGGNPVQGMQAVPQVPAQGGAAIGQAAAAQQAQQQAASAARPANPAIQRPAAQHQQIHESPDEGYHEDDAGSEVL